MPTDKRLLQICGILCLTILLLTVWSTRFVPMQDLPQHLFMAWLANHHADPALGLSEYFELRGQLGPYRASFLLQRLLESLAGIEFAAKVMVSLYLALVFCLLLKTQAETRGRHLAWGALLLVPASFHPMYFYGFLNFTLSIPLLMLSLYDLRSMLIHPQTRLGRTRQCAWVLALFLVHPYTLLVYIVLATVTIALPGWAGGRVRPAVGVFAAVALFAARAQQARKAFVLL